MTGHQLDLKGKQYLKQSKMYGIKKKSKSYINLPRLKFRVYGNKLIKLQKYKKHPQIGGYYEIREVVMNFKGSEGDFFIEIGNLLKKHRGFIVEDIKNTKRNVEEE